MVPGQPVVERQRHLLRSIPDVLTSCPDLRSSCQRGWRIKSQLSMVHKCLSEDKTEKSAAPVRWQEVEEWEDCANPETQVWKPSYCHHLSCPFWIPNVSEKERWSITCPGVFLPCLSRSLGLRSGQSIPYICPREESRFHDWWTQEKESRTRLSVRFTRLPLDESEDGSSKSILLIRSFGKMLMSRTHSWEDALVR